MMAKNKTGKNEEWLAGPTEPAQGREDRHEAGCIFLLPTLPLQLTKIGNRLGDYAIPIVASNRR